MARRGLHEPDDRSAIGSLLLVDDLEAEGLVKRDVTWGTGFQIVDEQQAPDGGPVIWFMQTSPGHGRRTRDP